MDKKAHSQEYLGDARDYWWNEDYLELLAKRLNLATCQSMVDVGCGKGYMAYKLAPYLPQGAKVFGIDQEQKWIDAATLRQGSFPKDYGVEFSFAVGNAKQIPLESAISDLTVCQTLLIHIDNPACVLSEMKRVTREGGWVVAIEPNNIAETLVADNLTGESIEEKLQFVEFRLRIEQGKKLLGEGDNSFGDLVPQLFTELGFRDIEVWLVDKPLSLIPPYDTKEKVLRAREILNWLEQEEVYLDYSEQLRYFLSGGGTEQNFKQYWPKNVAKMEQLKLALENETYISSGGCLMYIVAGRK